MEQLQHKQNVIKKYFNKFLCPRIAEKLKQSARFYSTVRQCSAWTPLSYTQFFRINRRFTMRAHLSSLFLNIKHFTVL